MTGGNTLTIDLTNGITEHRPGQAGTLRLPGLPEGTKDVEIWLPHNETTELVVLRTDAPIEPAPDQGRRVWLHHGSSISHGSDAASPTTTRLLARMSHIAPVVSSTLQAGSSVPGLETCSSDPCRRALPG
ncbi:hypothetical protein [Nonomuraea turkmeniaca]|uniref:hypothetical protein n=1 Tax=Nonomuraea turkmeniaca TaxID=103838 RepID=UPI0026B383BA